MQRITIRQPCESPFSILLEARLFAKDGNGSRKGERRLAEPDWAAVHRELKRKHMTLAILWEEYIATTPDGMRIPGVVISRSR